ncbi:MAG: hypothetical protein ACOCXQ_04495 [Patescibacteria group bacterium]
MSGPNVVLVIGWWQLAAFVSITLATIANYPLILALRYKNELKRQLIDSAMSGQPDSRVIILPQTLNKMRPRPNVLISDIYTCLQMGVPLSVFFLVILQTSPAPLPFILLLVNGISSIVSGLLLFDKVARLPRRNWPCWYVDHLQQLFAKGGFLKSFGMLALTVIPGVVNCYVLWTEKLV